ncbi:transporter [Fusarium sp. NRRL 25303]|nr:transporter [Fusarium sp. NRRL 25303]
MRFSQIAPLALWVGKGAASGNQLFHDTFQLNELPNMVSLADAKMKDIVLPDSLSDFTEWIGGIAEPQAFGLQPRQRQCVDPGYLEDAAAEARPSAVHPDATTPTRQSAVVTSVEIVPRDMTACQAVDVVLLVRSDVEIASAITREQQLAVPALELYGPVQSPVTAVQVDIVPILLPNGVARMSTDTVTTTKMKTVRVTTDIEPETGDAPEFTCVPMTATNDEGATLELDEGCTLHYEPPEATTTDDSAARLRRDAATAPAHVNRGINLLGRQLSCTPFTTYTRTEWETETETETGTKTVTVQGEDATFSCPEMEVTNDVGDTLALDAECVLSFTPAETTSSEEGASAQDQPTNVPSGTGESTTTVTATAGSGGSNDNSDSLSYLDISDATVITFLVPTLTAFIAWVALREPFTVKEASAGFIAFAGVLFVARPAFLFPESWRTLSELESRAVDPDFTTDGGILPPVKATPQERTIAILCAIFGSFAAATAYATIRVIGKRAHSLVSVNYFAVLATVSSFLIIMIHPDLQFEIPKTIAEWCLLLSIGISGFLLQLLLTEGLQREKAGRATNLIYVQMVFALIIERIVWGTTPPITSFIGSALIIGSAIWVSLQKKAPADPRPLLDEERRQQ